MHYEKFKKTAVWKELAHDSRTQEITVNKDIDKGRSPLNYNLCEHANGYDYYKKRLSEVKVQNRADVNTLCSWIITKPKDLPDADLERFFKESYSFMADRYGRENVVSAWVHMDETTAHLHFKFIPVVEDKRHEGCYKCSAKECVDRSELKAIHKDIARHMENVFGRDIGLLNGSTAGGNRTVQELKNEALVAENISLQSKVFDSQRTIKRAEQAEKALADLEGRVQTAQAIKEQTVKSSGFFNKGKVVMEYSEYMDLKKTAMEVDTIKQIEAALRSRERELAQEAHHLDERERMLSASIDKVINERVEQSVDRILRNVDEADKLALAEAFIKRNGMANEYKDFTEQTVIGHKKQRIRQSVKEYDWMIH